MQRERPILFNAEMVRKILAGEKTATRRPVRYKYSNTEMRMRTDKYGTYLVEIQKDVEGETYGKNPDGSTWHKLLGYVIPEAPYKKGDLLYVRETWAALKNPDGSHKKYVYRATDEYPFGESGYIVKFRWHPSIHMPKAATRIWLEVTDVRLERLQEITEEGIEKEGILLSKEDYFGKFDYLSELYVAFSQLWDSTVNKANLCRYGWGANPYVWVIEFRIAEHTYGIHMKQNCKS